MVQHYQSPVRVYKYPFELVMVAYERRFPRCPQIPVVLDCEVTADSWSDNNCKRDTVRRCRLAVEAPYILKKIIGVEVVFFIQHNTLDMKARTLIIEATNESFSTRVCVQEKCRYYVHPDNSSWTCFDQTATLDIKNFFGFENSMERLAMKQYSQNIAKGKEIIEYFIKDLEGEGLTYVSPWSDPSEISRKNSISPNTEGAVGTSICETLTSDTNSNVQGDLIDAEHLRRCSGNLTPLEESALLQFKKLMSEVGESPSVLTLLRFLRARDFNVTGAKELLLNNIKWRKEHGIDQLRKHYRMPSVLAAHFPGGWHNHDLDGRPLYLLRLGHMDVKGLIKSVGEEGLLKLTLNICEEGLRRVETSSKHLDKVVEGWCLLVDLEGLNMRHLWRPGVRALLRIIETVEVNYPDTMGRVLVVRAPRVFPILWTLVSTFIDENTRSKFLFFAAGDSLDGLSSLIPSENIPDFLGGTSKSLMHEGGLVPKSLYVVGIGNASGASGDHMTNGPELQALYHAVQLKPEQVHEILVSNSDPRSVLTWDFDVLGREVNFSVYRTSLNIATNNDGKISVLDNEEWTEGQHYDYVEKAVLCRDGESVQGSHVMAHHATYILQWRCDSQNETNSSTARVMYHHETLSSADYRGSMTSLQSGLSAMSVASSCLSR